MTDPTPEQEPIEDQSAVRTGTVGSVLEVLAMVLVTGAGFAAPTDWNITLGLVLLAGCLFALGFFALAGS